jgi:hypothetical protein
MIKTILWIVTFFFVSSTFGSLPNGYEYLGKGIDITTANLMPTSVQEVDDNFGKPNIYTVSHSSDIYVTPLTSGQFSISSTEISTVSDITNSLSVAVSVSGSYGVCTFVKYLD